MAKKMLDAFVILASVLFFEKFPNTYPITNTRLVISNNLVIKKMANGINKNFIPQSYHPYHAG